MAQLAEVDPPMDCRAQMLTLGTTTIELLGWRTPAVEGSASTSRRQVGFTHLAVLVADPDGVHVELTQFSVS